MHERAQCRVRGVAIDRFRFRIGTAALLVFENAFEKVVTRR